MEMEVEMLVLTCDKELQDEAEKKRHCRSKWHRYNLKRKVAEVPGVTEALFQARQSALAEERNKLSSALMLCSCGLCGKEYRSSKAYAQHLKSRAHAMKASQESDPAVAGATMIKPIAGLMPSKSTLSSHSSAVREMDGDKSEERNGGQMEVDRDDELEMESESLTNLHVNEQSSVSGADHAGDIDEVEDLDPLCCFVCDRKHHDIESCMVHLHKRHGFFIPDIEYLKDPEGLLTYAGLKVKRDFTCLYCNERCHPFQSLEAIRKHIIAKGHCKLRYGDGGDDDDGDLEDFYDYSSSYLDVDGRQLVAADDMVNRVELGTGGSELILTRRTDDGVLVRTLGSREFLRYYRQKPRPSPARDIARAISLASRQRSMVLATVQSKEQLLGMKILKQMNQNGLEAMRSKIGTKSNVIRNLPRNVPH